MPRITDDMTDFNISGGFQFSGTKIEHLGATSYTLASVFADSSSSVIPFSDLIVTMMKTVNLACKKSPHSDNIMIRVCSFSTYFHTNGINEIHGFKPVETIDADDYNSFNPMGGTPLYDAVYSGIASTLQYAKELHDNGYTSNAIIFIITDGDNNQSIATTKMIKDEIDRIRASEQLDSILTVLLGININDGHMKLRLEQFVKEVGIDRFEDAGKATPQNVAKMADFVSQSVSSTAQAQGTGGPSQNINPVI